MNRLLKVSLLVVIFSSETCLSNEMETPMQAIHLASACNDNSAYAQGFCEGAIDALYSSTKSWCVADVITHGEVSRYIKQELLAESNLNGSAQNFIDMLLAEKWPCKR